MECIAIPLLLIAVVCSRLLPFLRWGTAPLGYDTGFYIRNALHLAEGSMDLFAAGPLYWLWWIPLRVGVPPEALIHGMLLLSQFGLALAFYWLGVQVIKACARTELIPWGGAVAVGIFATALSQFLGYWWMFLRQEVAMVFLVSTLALLVAQRARAAAVVGGIGGAIHPATFLPLGITLLLLAAGYTAGCIWFRWRGRSPAPEMTGALSVVLTAGSGMLLIAALLSPSEFRGYGSWFLAHRAVIAPDIPPWKIPELRGFFIDFPTLLIATFAYLPFAITGAIALARNVRRHHTALPSILLIAFAVVGALLSSSAEIIFNRRFLLIFDIALIALAVLPAAQFLHWLAESPWGRRSVAGLAIGLTLNVFWFAWSAEPQVTPQELQEITALRAVVAEEPHARAMATDARYTPWVYGYSRLPTIAPGYLDQNRWALEEWAEFWVGRGGIERRRELFRRYEPPIYVFVGSRSPRVDRFLREDDAFAAVSPHIWKYDGVYGDGSARGSAQ